MSVTAPGIFRHVANSIDRSVDRIIGADQLKPRAREQLYAQQLRSSMQMAPTLLVWTIIVSAMFLALTFGHPSFWAVVAWAIAVNLAYSYAAASWFRMRRRPAVMTVSRHIVGLAVLFAALHGALWGLAMNLLPLGDPLIRAAATLGVGGMLCASIMALVNFPQVSIAFVVPLLTGVAVSLVRLGNPADLTVRGILISAFVTLLMAVSVRHARSFVAYRASEASVNEKKEIIGLLLKEFELSASDWIWGFDSAGRIDRVSKGFMTATGLPEGDLIGADLVHFLTCITPPDDTLMMQLQRDFDMRQTFSDVEIRVTAGGAECWWRMTGKPVLDEAGQYAGYIGTVSDVSAKKLAEKRITMLAHNDPLTGLLNRTKFTEHLNLCVARLDRYGSPFSVMFLDLDHFKLVNDRSGHPTGDKLLVQVAKRLQGLVRENDLIARLGGDEFAIILTNDCAPEHNAALAARVIEEIGKPFLIDDDVVTVGVSIGIALAPENGARPDQLLRNGDMALYRAKADGRSIYRFFESQMDSDARERRTLELELRDAMKNGELVLYYQPLINTEDNRPTGFEALIRWRHPTRGIVAPAAFIPIAEQTGLILEIGDWTIEQACLAAANWPENLTVAVNLSAKHFRLSNVALIVRKALTVSGLAPERLELEITEGVLLENPEQVAAKLAEIRALGVNIALDDFGTGYSSLSYLSKFRFDRIKIDNSLIAASNDDAVAREMLRAIATLSKTLKLKITAEGVETREQAEFLSEIAYHQLQGFFFAKPLDAIDLPQYLLTQMSGRAKEADGVAAVEKAAG